MAERYLASYLNDHLAGSSVGLEFLEHLERVYTGTAVAEFASKLRSDIQADRQELETLMARLQVTQSRPRKAAAWLGEKLTEIKLWWDDPAHRSLHLLEVLDAVSVGIEGKRLLWRALNSAAKEAPKLQGTDYARLEQRAEEQRQRVEVVRLEAAQTAFQ